MILAAWTLCGLLAAPLPADADPPPEGPIDPFYSSLLLRGAQSYQEGSYAAAARELRVACFGHLEAPRALATCLVRLAAAQGQDDDREAFLETFQRIVEVEDRFQGYSQAEIPAEIRQDLERFCSLLVPEAQLRASRHFAYLSARQAAGRIARLPPRERRVELERLIEEEPREVRWRLLLADLEMDRNHPAAVITQTSTALDLEADLDHAYCLRGLARQRIGRCELAVSDLESCGRAGTEEVLAEAYLLCLGELERWTEARTVLEGLAADVRNSRTVSKLRRRIERNATATASAGTPVEGAAEAEQEITASELPAETNGAPEPAPTDPPAETVAEEAPPASRDREPELTPEDRERLATARRLLGEARHAGELEEPLALANALAADYPKSRDVRHLAAQIAYRASKWDQAVGHFEAGGDPGEDAPVLLFYLAVSYFEAGQVERARETLRRCLPNLDQTPFVERYRQRILGEDGPS